MEETVIMDIPGFNSLSRHRKCCQCQWHTGVDCRLHKHGTNLFFGGTVRECAFHMN